jgi:hypothetical protein
MNRLIDSFPASVDRGARVTTAGDEGLLVPPLTAGRPMGGPAIILFEKAADDLGMEVGYTVRLVIRSGSAWWFSRSRRAHTGWPACTTISSGR